MSERQQRGQAKQFQHQRDRAFQENIKSKNIFSDRPEVFKETFRCCPVEQRLSLCDGEAVILLPRDTCFEVVKDFTVVGRVDGGTDILSQALLSDSRAGGLIKASISRPPGLSGHFEIRVTEAS